MEVVLLDSSLETVLRHKHLQALCKANGIPGNLTVRFLRLSLYLIIISVRRTMEVVLLDSSLETVLRRKHMQALCKATGIPGNLTVSFLRLSLYLIIISVRRTMEVVLLDSSLETVLRCKHLQALCKTSSHY